MKYILVALGVAILTYLVGKSFQKNVYVTMQSDIEKNVHRALGHYERA